MMRKAGMKWVDRVEEEGNGVAEGGERTVGRRWEVGGGRRWGGGGGKKGGSGREVEGKGVGKWGYVGRWWEKRGESGRTELKYKQ